MPLNESFVFASLSSGNLTGGNKDVTEDHVSDTSIDGILSDDASHDSDTIYKDDVVSDDVLPAEDEVLQDDSQDVDELLQDHSTAPTQYRVDIDGTSVFFTVTPLDDVAILPASVVPSTANYTPQAWQINLAEHRSLGEHYLMWAQRTSYGSTYYWRYYLAIGRNISYSSNTYTYHDAELYTYYTYNNSTTYNVLVSSGTVSGTTYLVYSDLFFDYVGADPVLTASPYITFLLAMIIIALLVIGGKRNV